MGIVLFAVWRPRCIYVFSRIMFYVFLSELSRNKNNDSNNKSSWNFEEFLVSFLRTKVNASMPCSLGSLGSNLFMHNCLVQLAVNSIHIYSFSRIYSYVHKYWNQPFTNRIRRYTAAPV